ncbi:MAG: SpoIIE family protein phosphatase [Planctomycetes bacterium]|nr:SpoIIE family protein phosphatase [Planctomycetota bacterium]
MNDRSVRILLVEDDPDDVWVMRGLLGDRWDGPFELIHAESLAAGLQRCARGGIDVMLLDLTLPDSLGLETFIVMQSMVSNVPIVVLTGLDDETTAVKAVQAGAQDYLVKGQVDDNLLVRSIRYAIERTRRHEAEDALRITNEEFRTAREIQQRLFPVAPPKFPGFEIDGAVFPAKATAGDCFDYIPMGERRLGVVLGDVSSHGMGPALLMAETRAYVRALSLACDDVGQILTGANRVLADDTDDLHFVTLMFALLDADTRRLTYASAGQRGYLFDAGGNFTHLDSTSLPLGVEKSTVVPCAEPIQLEESQLVFFCTDGVMEAESPDGEYFGADRAMKVVRENRHEPAGTIVQRLYQTIREFSGNAPQQDDITLVVIRVVAPEP